jgi:hypothetical protein
MLLYACTIFLSAFLLFQVQPVIARMILPWFGGSAAVWTTCMLFFQVVLLLGYLYVYWTVRHLPARTHGRLHSALLALSVALLPITPGVQWKPAGEGNPSIEILVLLAACVGAQYFLLSTTSPLLQSWYSRTGHGVLPYRLFALSNFGSLLALITYPVVVEPLLSSRMQGTVWSAAYVVFVVLCVWTAHISTRDREIERAAAAGEEEIPAPPGRKTLLLWVALAACPSALLLSITNHLTQDVASIPFLWIVPLTIYLLSFILCFDADGWYQRPIYMALLWPALIGMAYMLHKGTEDINLKIMLSAFSAAFFICCMVCHGELVKVKPHPRYLTSFYLMLSIGGAAGGVLVGVVAPYLFISYFEFPISLVLCGTLAIAVLLSDPKSRFYRSDCAVRTDAVSEHQRLQGGATELLRHSAGAGDEDRERLGRLSDTAARRHQPWGELDASGPPPRSADLLLRGLGSRPRDPHTQAQPSAEDRGFRPGSGESGGLWTAGRYGAFLRDQSVGGRTGPQSVLLCSGVAGEGGDRPGRCALVVGARAAERLRRAGGGLLLGRFDSGAPAHQGGGGTLLPPSEARRDPGGACIEPLSGSGTGGGEDRGHAQACAPAS